METSKRPDGWWRIRLLADLKGKRILDPVVWRERWKGKLYRTRPKVKGILNELQKAGVDSTYIEWLLRPEYLKGRPGHPDSRLPEKAQQEIIALFDELDALLKKMREMVDQQRLPGRPVEIFRQWFRSFEKDVEPACPPIGGYPKISRELRNKHSEWFKGRPQDERVFDAFLISEELREVLPRRYWPIVANLMRVRFPADKEWSTPSQLSRAVGQLKKRAGKKKSQAIVEAHRQWFKQFTPKPDSITAGHGTPSA